MRTIFSKLIFLPCLLTLISCKEKEDTGDSSISLEHDYGEISNLEIEWENLFSICENQYLVYFYSPFCSHCKEIKNEIIEYALSNEGFYFIRFSSKVRVAPDIENTIGATSIEDAAILGTPSLIEISNSVLTNNIAGTKAILNFLKIPFPD